MEIRGTDLRRHWDLPGALDLPEALDLAGPRPVPLTGGMNSRTWRVDVGAARYVVKAVPAAEGAALRNGMRLAAHLDGAGFATGAPVAARDGRYVVEHDHHAVVLLRWVAGRALTADDQAPIGETLGRVHRALRGAPAPQPFCWLDPDAPHLALEPWLRPAVRDALRGYEALGPLTVGPLHADPAPEAFRCGDAGCGLIDWSSAHRGPLLYDLASAVMYVGGTARAGTLIDAYRATGALGPAEIGRGLEALVRLRWAVQADYFARRSMCNDLTGIAGPDGNAQGLADARRALARPLHRDRAAAHLHGRSRARSRPRSVATGRTDTAEGRGRISPPERPRPASTRAMVGGLDASTAGVAGIETVVAHSERTTLRVGDVFLKIDADRTRADVEVEAMARAPIPTPQVLWRTPPVLALAALPGIELGRLGEPSTAPPSAWAAAGAAVRKLHDAPLPPWPGPGVDELAARLDRECAWAVASGALPADLVARNRQIAAAALRPWTPVFIHGDLQVCHVFVDGDEVTGVLDWSEAARGDALFDLAILTLGHEEHLADVVAGYGTGVDLDVVRAWWSLRSLLAARWLIEHGFDPNSPGCEFDVLRSRM